MQIKKWFLDIDEHCIGAVVLKETANSQTSLIPLVMVSTLNRLDIVWTIIFNQRGSNQINKDDELVWAIDTCTRISKYTKNHRR